MMYGKKQMDAAIQHARDEYPAESVGFFYVQKGRMKYHRATNVSGQADNFVVSPEEYDAVEALGEIVALVHSHPDASPLPSVLDQRAHEASGLDWVIIGLMGDAVDVHVMPALSDALPLYGRDFVHGVTDCYAFIRDWYAANFEVTLPDFVRPDDWWHKGQDLYVENFAKAGFVAVDDAPMVGDVLLMTIGAAVSNHAAIYADDNQIEHHLFGRLSGRDVYGQFYRDRTTHVLRHESRATHD